MIKLSPWKKQVAENFSGAVTHYDAYATLQEGSARTLMEFAPEPKADMRILELGCGTGNLTKHLLSKYKNATISITDISADIVLYNQEQYESKHSNAHWKIMDGEQLGSNAQYDLIIANMVFQWFVDLDGALERMRAALKPSGQILFSVPGPDTFKEWRETLNTLDLPSGTLRFPALDKPVHSEERLVSYQNAYDFLRQIKAIGAHHPRADYKSLSAAQLRKACRLFDQNHNGKLHWQIQYARLTA